MSFKRDLLPHRVFLKKSVLINMLLCVSLKCWRDRCSMFECRMQCHINGGKKGRRNQLKIEQNWRTQRKQRCDAKQRAEVRRKSDREHKTNGVGVGADEKNKWSVSVEVLQRGRGEREPSDAYAYTLPWSEYTLDDLCSLSNIEPLKKKNYILLNYWWLYFERIMWWGRGRWMCEGGLEQDWPSDVAIMQLKNCLCSSLF